MARIFVSNLRTIGQDNLGEIKIPESLAGIKINLPVIVLMAAPFIIAFKPLRDIFSGIVLIYGLYGLAKIAEKG